MKKLVKGIACTALALSVATVSVGPYGVFESKKEVSAKKMGASYEVKGESWKYGLGDACGFNETTYSTVKKATGNNNWREGSVSGNGEIAFIESCDPEEDVFIFNNTKIVTDGSDIYETPVLNPILDDQRMGAITRDNFPWVQQVNTYAKETFGTNWGTTWPRKYQPAAQYRIINNQYSAANSEKYNRYTNYETGEVGVQWKDDAGNEWDRRSFASREDDVIVTYIEAPEGKDLDLTLSIDNMVEMRNQGTTNPRPTSDNIVTKDDKGYAFGMVGKYAINDRKGSKNEQETKFARGGWGTATRVVTDGNVDYKAETRDVTVPGSFGGGTIKNANDPKLTITGTNSIILITKVDRIDTGCDDTDDVKDKLYDKLVQDIDTVVGKYSVKNDEDSYQNILKPHVDIHGGMFKQVRIDLCSTEQEKADRALTNTELINKQDGFESSINKAFLERIYNNGRFGLICASGYGSTRLGGIWNGAWEPDWSGDFTLDANTNLQVSGMNTGNMKGAGDGYINFIVRMVEDWDDDATNIYGMKDAIKAPPRVDGTGEAGSFHFLEGYPHVYVNGITDWLIIPMFEYWQCYGNQQIKVGKDVDIDRNKEVMDYSDEDVARIKSTGMMDLEKDILYPMLKKTMNFWLQYVDENYYTDGKGVEHAKDGTTIQDAIAAGDNDCKYIFTPGYSPENTPKGYAGNSKYALAYNTTMDIAASRDTLFMAKAILDVINPSDKDELLKTWNDFESKIPEYMYDKTTGALKEWTSPKLEDNHKHRHVSHAYVAWPGYETQSDNALRVGVDIAMQERSKAFGGDEASESHGPTHKALVEARIKNAEGLEKVLLYLMTSGYQYSSMMTSHNSGHGSTYCTDSAFGIMGAINESLLYSNTGVVEILPALMVAVNQGSISGLRARCNTQCDIQWDINNGKASTTLVSDEDDNVVKVRCAKAWKSASIGGVVQKVKTDEDGMPCVELTLKKGEKVQVDFALAQEDSRIHIESDLAEGNVVKAGDTISLQAITTFAREEAKDVTWTFTNASDGTKMEEMTVKNGTLTIPEAAKGSIIKVMAKNATGVESGEFVLYVAEEKSEFQTALTKSDDEITVNIVNDGEGKTVNLLLVKEDSEGQFDTLNAMEVTLGANEFEQVQIPTAWDYAGAKMYIWEKETNTPCVEPIEVK